MKNFISCVIVTYNTDKSILKVIESLENQVSKIIIVDNGSSESTKEIFNKNFDKDSIDIIYNGSNLGIAKALNIGVNQALKYNSDWILTLDHDSILDNNMINNMMSFYDSLSLIEKEKVSVLAPEILDVSINKSYYKVEDDSKYKDVNHVIQSGALIKSEVFIDGLFFNEELFIYFVDLEFCYDIREKGNRIVMVKGANLYHEEGEKERRTFLGLKYTYDNYSIFAIYYITRNAVYMFKKYKKLEFIKRIVYDFIKILLSEPKKLKYMFSGIVDAVLGKYGKKFN